MEEKGESERSYSGESSSSSNSCAGSSEGDDAFEPVHIMGQTYELPQEFCEDYSVFKEVFSMKTWESLNETHKERLKNFLPKFSENEEAERDKTVQMLFNYEPFHFTSPLDDLFNNLKQGNYRPDIVKMRNFLMKARAKQQKQKMKSYYAKLLPEVLISRECLLAVAKGAPPGPIPDLPPVTSSKNVKDNTKNLYLRTRQRYFEEMAAIRGEVGGDLSDDENYPEGPPEPPKRRRNGNQGTENISSTLSNMESSQPTSLECLKHVLAAHRARRRFRDNHPELNTNGITLEDIKQRVAIVNGAKRVMFGGQKVENIPKLKRGPKKEAGKPKELKSAMRKLEGNMEPILPNIKLKCERDESDSESSSFVDPVASPKRPRKYSDEAKIKQEVDMKYSDTMQMDYTESKPDMDSPPSAARIIQPVPIKLEDLDGIDMMDLPVELVDESSDLQVEGADKKPVVDPDESLTETTHANFLSLVRALFPAKAAHRASKEQLHARLNAVMKSPIAALNTWYNLCGDWCAELDSALEFLAGERGSHPDDFVPYLQYIPDTQMYQWIGAGRDCDSILERLCARWLRTAPSRPSNNAPPPRNPSSWKVRTPTNFELSEFRAQERKRFAQAAKPFTYAQFGYRAVVGPCLRCGASGTASTLVKGSGTRPRHATFISLLRDAVARLPNGEGTRHDVLTMIKMSQWIVPCSDQTLLSAITTTLEKMQAAKRDQFVKYDHKTAIWTYLFRHRSEEDWVKCTARTRKPLGVNTPLPELSDADPVSTANTKDTRPQTPLAAMEVEIGGGDETADNESDTDVDVDDSGSSTSEQPLSSAQLLMQATQNKTPPTIPAAKLKTKLSPPSPVKKQPKPQPVPSKSTPKPSPPPKQTTLMSQAVKQAAIIAQSTKNIFIQQPKPVTQPKQIVVHPPKQIVAQPPKPPPQVKPNIPSPRPETPKTITQQVKPIQSPKHNVQQIIKPVVEIPKQPPTPTIPKTRPVVQPVQQIVQKQNIVVQAPKSSPSQLVARSPLIKQRPLVKTIEVQRPAEAPVGGPESLQVKTTVVQKSADTVQKPEIVMPVATASNAQQLTSNVYQLTSNAQQTVTTPVAATQPGTAPSVQPQSKLVSCVGGARSLLIRSPAVTGVGGGANVSGPAVSQATLAGTGATRRGVVRVLSPAAGKSLISPQALLHQGSPNAAKKRITVPSASSLVTSVAQSASSVTTVVSSVSTTPSSSVPTRTVQLAGGRTVQLAANQTVTLPSGQSVQLANLQLSSLQLPTQTVRLPSGQTVQLATSQSIQTVKNLPAKNVNPRITAASPKTSSVQIPASSVQTVQIAGQHVQLTGQTVKLPSGQSVQVAGQTLLSPQTVQIGGQTVQVQPQTVQALQMSSGQTVQIGGQTLQLPSGQTLQLSSGQTIQLPGGQTLQLQSGQTLQFSGGQTVQIAGQPQKVTQIVRQAAPGEKVAQPLVTKFITNAQGQMVPLESVRGVHMGGATLGRGRGVRLVPPTARLTRPLLLAGKHLILQQSDSSAVRMTSSGTAAPTQTLMLGNIAQQTATTTTAAAPVLKLQQAVGASASTSTSNAVTTVRNVLMDGQQLKLVGGRHVLARLIRPAQPPP